MSQQWTSERILALAPDASSAKSGKELSSPRRWQNLGRKNTAVWGECQGSGSKPYQTQIDLTEPAFKCSCPSRKFPCKHSLGLFLILAEHPESITGDSVPGWVEQWLASRAQRAEKRTAKSEEAAKPPDPAAQAKRIADRERKIAGGLEQLENWLKDLVSRGLAAVQGEGPAPWEQMASRMVDAQAPGVARLLREAAAAANSGNGWQQRLLLRLSRMQLLIESYRRIASLPESLQAEIRTLIGWNQPTDELMAQTGLRDNWQVVGQRVSVEDRLRVQRTWLWGTTSRRLAMLLQFAHGTLPFADTVIPGTRFDAELVYYAGAYPMRAILKQRISETMPVARFDGYEGVAQAIGAYGQALASNPWLELFPVPLSGITVERNAQADAWWLRDTDGQTLPVSSRFGRAWQLHAQSGGHPIGVFGEWDGESLHPLSVAADNAFTLLVRE